MRVSTVEIEAGTLRLQMSHEKWPLDRLLTFATRENPKRAFLFVSKVLGRHWPCRPSLMRRSYDILAAGLASCPGPVLVIGMAETATGLGHGVFDSLLRATGRSDITYFHTTRHRLNRQVAIRIDESHSHAVEHLVYQPDPVDRNLFLTARTLVLVDDEISTGKTLAALAGACVDLNPSIEQVRVATLVSWLPDLSELERSCKRPVQVDALAAGIFEFERRDGFFPGPPACRTQASRPGRYVGENFGRIGFRGRFELSSLPELPRGSRLLVIGTGEFAYPPFRLAEMLEQEGHDVLFQASTRSPIRLGAAILSRLVFEDHHGEGVTNYLYNAPDDDRVAIVGYEHESLAHQHSLVKSLGGIAWSPQTGSLE